MMIMMNNGQVKEKKKLNYQPSKLGRKGDPRMHAAMKARLSDPKLSLYDALRRGGFKFYHKSDGLIYDADNVSLSQRKNQLSRRIRLHKKHGHSEDGDDNAGGISETSVTSNNCNGSSWNEDYMQGAHHDICTIKPVQEVEITVYNNNFKRIRATKSTESVSGENAAAITTSTNEFDNSQIFVPSNHDVKPPKRRMSSFSIGMDMNQLEDPRLNIAIDNFRSEIAALFKKSMIRAGYAPSETDECDQAYMTFVEKALQEESSRIQRMRSAMMKNKSNGDLQVYFNGGNQEHGMTEEYSRALWMSHSHGHSHEHSIDHSIDHSRHSIGKLERKCLHSRHFHRLEGKCGHQAIVHKPPGGNPHIDFVVNDKVECYEGCNPMIDYSAFWPSSFSAEEGAVVAQGAMEEQNGMFLNNNQGQLTQDAPNEDQQRYHYLQCLGEDCKPPPNDPKIFDFKDIDMTCGEWSKIFSEDDSSKSDEAALGTLFSLQKQSDV